MSVKKIQIKPPDNSYADVLHPETDSTQVLMTAGETLETFKTNTNNSLNGKINHSLATAANDFLVASGAGAFIKKTLAEVRTLLSCLLTTGGTMSGELNCARNIVNQPQLKGWSQTVEIDNYCQGNETLNASIANVFNYKLTFATTFSFSCPIISGQAYAFRLFLQVDETLYGVTWPVSVTWENHTTPTLSMAIMHEFEFVSINGGSGWYGRLIAKY